MTRTLDERIEDYLDGQLSEEETRQFEIDLLRKEVGTAFREALAIRELLNGLPPDEPSPDLVTRIETSLDLDSSPSTGKTKPKRTSSMGMMINGFKWGLRWPGFAIAGIYGCTPPLKNSFSGMDTVGYSLGPLNDPVRERLKSIRLPKKPLWKIALSRWW